MRDINVIRTQFRQYYGVLPHVVIRAPGRVNLLGEHTDYNDGYVLPAAIDRATYIAAYPREDRQIAVTALDLAAQDVFTLDRIARSTTNLWSNYLRGVVKELLAAGHSLNGANLLVTSDVPRGAGLSSSAALEVATGYTFQVLNQFELTGEALALLAQRAENEFVGVQCGIMDQFISALGRAGHALLLDCRNLRYRFVSLPSDVAIVVCDSHIERTLAGSAYNQRRQECSEAVRILRQWYPEINALRDVTLESFQRYEDHLPVPVRLRARHVIAENERVLRGATALECGEIATFGQLMNEAHTSLRDDYQVSIPQIDLLVAAAQQIPGCFGSRLTGAGFGGCTVSLVRNSAVELFCRDVADAYRQSTGRETTIYVCQASNGVGQVS